MRLSLSSPITAVRAAARWFAAGRAHLRDIEGLLHRGSSADLIKRKRIRIAIIAVLVGLVSASIDLPLPAEDAFRAARAKLRTRPAPQDIVLVAIDDATLNTVQRSLPSRMHDSIVIDNLMAAGARKVVFDRAHADPETPAADAQFVETLQRHKGKVWLGASPPVEHWYTKLESIKPHEKFRAHSQMASMLGKGHPFGLSVTFPTFVQTPDGPLPSISAVLADYQGPPLWYRPDYAFNPLTIPKIGYHQVLADNFAPSDVANKSIVIGETHLRSNDNFSFRLGETLPGVYFHILGAHTLKRNVSVDLAWYPAMLVAVLALAAQIFLGFRSHRIIWLAAGALFIAPLAFDEMGLSIDTLSAALVLLVASIGFRQIAKKYYNNEVDAFNTSAIPLDKINADQDVYAVKIANLAELSEEWSATQMGEFIANLISFIKGPGDAVEVAFDKDVLLWLAPRMGAEALEKHADGLAMMLKMTINHSWQSASSTPALGIDTHYDLPLGQRVKKAVQAADEAVTRGLRFIVNNAAYFEARQQRLEMVRLLEKAIRERSIGVGYQPKVDLQTGLVVGAEALIRWRPDGGEFINPQELVLTAEANDMINDLTLIVMDTAFRDAKKALLIDPRFKLAINMSAKSLSDTHFLFDVMTLLGEHRFPGRNLTLELTETAKLEDASIAAQIKALRQRNISLSIDDFGTGQSNMEYLEKLPSNELKIDKRFVQGMASSEESKAIVRATIEIAHSLGKVVVAEGVEDLAVAAELRAMNCDQGQGFLFSRAIAMDELVALIRQRSAAA